jgi:hypothetical protein
MTIRPPIVNRRSPGPPNRGFLVLDRNTRPATMVTGTTELRFERLAASFPWALVPELRLNTALGAQHHENSIRCPSMNRYERSVAGRLGRRQPPAGGKAAAGARHGPNGGCPHGNPTRGKVTSVGRTRWEPVPQGTRSLPAHGDNAGSYPGSCARNLHCGPGLLNIQHPFDDAG